MSTESYNNKRIFYLDVLRVIACFAVISIHSCVAYVIENVGSLNFWIANILDSISRVAVPIFVMISGALMLDKNYNFSKEKIKKHIIKMITFFIFWSAIYCIFFNIIGNALIEHESVDIIKVIGSFIKGYYHLWFVYLIIGLYLIVPLLRLWVKEENKKWVEYFLILSVICTYLIPTIISIGKNYCELFNYMDNLTVITYVGGFTGYFILGWYLHNYDLKNTKYIYILGAVGVVITTVGTYIISVTTGTPIQLYNDLNFNVLLQAIAIFVFVKRKFMSNNIKHKSVIVSVSKYSLGIYAMHAGIITLTYKVLNALNLNFALINILIVVAVTFTISYIISILFSRIKFLNKLV